MKASRLCIVRNRDGIHARPSAQIVKRANQFGSSISIFKLEGETVVEQAVNAKSLLTVMQLAACFGNRLLVVAEGEDADQAVDAVVEMVETEFNYRLQDEGDDLSPFGCRESGAEA